MQETLRHDEEGPTLQRRSDADPGSILGVVVAEAKGASAA
jgi:hypothetical protein